MKRPIKKVMGWKVLFTQGTELFSESFSTWKQARRFMKTHDAFYITVVFGGVK